MSAKKKFLAIWPAEERRDRTSLLVNLLTVIIFMKSKNGFARSLPWETKTQPHKQSYTKSRKNRRRKLILRSTLLWYVSSNCPKFLSHPLRSAKWIHVQEFKAWEPFASFSLHISDNSHQFSWHFVPCVEDFSELAAVFVRLSRKLYFVFADSFQAYLSTIFVSNA